MSVQMQNSASSNFRVGTLVQPPQQRLGEKSGSHDEIQCLLGQLSALIQQNMAAMMSQMKQARGSSVQGGLNQLQLQLGMLKTIEQMQKAGGQQNPFAALAQQYQNQHSGAICPCEPGQEPQPPEIGPDQKMARMDAVSTLQRHKDLFKKAPDRAGMEKMMNDKDTPNDLKAALKTMLSDQGLMDKLDGAKKNGKLDGRVGTGDIDKLAQDPELKAYNNEKAKGYTDNYVPSDDLSRKPRPMTEHDAQTELYKYADYLPKDISQEELKKIVDGTGKEGKCPPQLIAAAKYYTDHPDQWKALNGGKDKVSTARMEDNISNNQPLSQPQSDALNRLKEDPNKAFFGSGNLNREKLQKIADDPKAAKEDKDAANTLLKDEVLFSKIDNGKNGRDIHGIKSWWLKSDDAQIGKGDVDAMIDKTKDKPVWKEPAAPETPAVQGRPLTLGMALEQAEDAKAASDMVNSGADAQENKGAKGGWLKNAVDNIKHGFEKIGEGFVKIGEGIKNFAEGAVKAIGGAFKVVGGALTFNPELIKQGANNVKDGATQSWKAVDTTIKGAGEVLGGAASAVVSMSPAGMAINEMTGNAASRLASGVFEGMADTVVKGRNGLINVAEGVVTGDMKQALQGGLDFVNLASMFVPGAGQANMARNIAQNAGKELVKDGVKGTAKDEVMLQYRENRTEGTQQA